MTYSRGYHSSAILLADGSVLMGGDQAGSWKSGESTPHERYYPWYCFRARPVITGAPSSVAHGATFTVDSPEAPTITALCLVRTLAALCFTLGYRTTWSGVAAGLSGYYLLFQEPFGFNATLHLLFQGVMLLAATDAGAVLALRPERARNVDSGKLLIRAFVASIYAWAGFVKLRADWLDGRTLALFHENGALFGPFADYLLGTAWRRALVARSIVATELTLPLLLFAPSTRRWAPYVALSLHVGIAMPGAVLCYSLS